MPSLWHRAEGDPGLIDAVRVAVDDRDDALDLLWWAEHPGLPTPAGRRDPGPAMEERRRALYRSGTRGEDAEAVAGAAAAHAAAVRRAADAARAAIAVREVLPEPGKGQGQGQGQEETTPVGTGRVVPAGRRGPERRTVLAVLAAGVALVVGVAIGAVAFGSTEHAGRPEASVPAYRVFARAQRASFDLPVEDEALPSFLEPATVRRLRAYSTIGTTLYAARAGDDRVCVFVVVLASPSPPACTTDAAFALGGLSLIVRASADPVDDSGRRPVDELDITWNPDDTVSITPYGLAPASRSPKAS